jgi:hypothetical protein
MITAPDDHTPEGVEAMLMRAFWQGEHVAELPPAVQAIVERLRHRVLTEAIPKAQRATRWLGKRRGQKVWDRELDRLFGVALDAIALALSDHETDILDYIGGPDGR